VQVLQDKTQNSEKFILLVLANYKELKTKSFRVQLTAPRKLTQSNAGEYSVTQSKGLSNLAEYPKTKQHLYDLKYWDHVIKLMLAL
jgi:hypothetical protein